MRRLTLAPALARRPGHTCRLDRMAATPRQGRLMLDARCRRSALCPGFRG